MGAAPREPRAGLGRPKPHPLLSALSPGAPASPLRGEEIDPRCYFDFFPFVFIFLSLHLLSLEDLVAVTAGLNEKKTPFTPTLCSVFKLSLAFFFFSLLFGDFFEGSFCQFFFPFISPFPTPYIRFDFDFFFPAGLWRKTARLLA